MRPLLNTPQDAPAPRRGVGALAPVLLGVFSVAGYFVFFAQNVFLARNLSRYEFNEYNVGVSGLLMLAALAPLGVEKLALKVVPVCLDRGYWGRLRGFLRFAFWTALVMSALLSLAMEGFVLYNGLDSHLSNSMVAGCLPLLAVFAVLLEVVTAGGRPIAAAAMYRLALPALMLGSNLAIWRQFGDVSRATASGSFLAAWLVATVAMGWLMWRVIPSQVRTDRPTCRPQAWLTESTPLLLHGLMLTAISQAGVIVLELSPDFHVQASVFAIAMQTGAFIAMFATSANRFYLPRVAVLLKQNDRVDLLRLSRGRLALMGGISAAFFLAVVVFGRAILRLHGEGFEEGYLATCVIAGGAAISTTFSLAPLGLQFSGRRALVVRSSVMATVVSLVACVVLANRYGALGAAIAYAAPMALLHMSLAYKGISLLVTGAEQIESDSV